MSAYSYVSPQRYYHYLIVRNSVAPKAKNVSMNTRIGVRAIADISIISLVYLVSCKKHTLVSLQFAVKICHSMI